jgi:formate/nitrite transporter FocA (FNT family)
MFFHSLALLSIIAMFTSAAAAAATHRVWQVTIGNATGGTIFTPNNIVGK